jgi:pimeloyl-ACP methyl ester carboxylesterase
MEKFAPSCRVGARSIDASVTVANTLNTRIRGQALREDRIMIENSTSRSDAVDAAPGTRSGYADVNGVHMYYELHGEGSPLVLLHGGMLTIDLNFAGLIPTLSRSHLVIGVELQGHGRTADVERAITPAALAEDVVGLLDHLGIDRAHVLGHSLGAGVALELAVNHPTRVRSVVSVSGSVRPDGMHEDLTDPAKMATSTRMPTPQDFADFRAAYLRLSPHPEHFDEFLATLSGSTADLRGWTDEQLAGVTAPTLLVFGDRDFVTIEHAALMQRLIPGAQLAVFPGTTHMQATRRPDLLLPMLTEFLD